MHLIIVVISFFACGYFIREALHEQGVMQAFLFFIALFTLLIVYTHAVPVFLWPCRVTVHRESGRITFCYLLCKKTMALERLERCVVSEAMNRYPYQTYLLYVKGGAVITLSDLTISQFPGPFAYNIGMDVSERLPRFFPGFRRLSHKRE
ncbi:MAG: hypothetical protein JNL43_10125 [Flavobacteriales bacterium]|nr:hypothetical protein [Flavobacteriales bacterium]